MGLDLSSIFGSSSTSASTGMTDALQMGGNAALGYLEGQAISTLQSAQSQSNTAAQAAASNLLASPSNPNGFSAYLTSLMTNPTLKQYGPYIMAGVAGVVILTLLLS